MLSEQEIKDCHSDWQRTEMSDLSSKHLESERLKIYHKWFVKLIDHARKVERAVWDAGL